MPSTILLRSLLLDLLLAIVSPALASEPDTLGITRRQHRLGEASVRGSLVRRVNASAFNAVAINTRQLAGTNLDLAHALEKVLGLKVREDGGVGSGININLNGFTGKHVKVFIDGVPIDASASSFSLGNIPAALASRIEVYKGVVPAELGGDALGGAINIVTDGQQHSFVDASYSYGSFNTHRSNLSAALALPGDGYVRLTAYQNYSDNDYRVRTQLTDLTTGIISQEESWFRCHHGHGDAGTEGTHRHDGGAHHGGNPWRTAEDVRLQVAADYPGCRQLSVAPGKISVVPKDRRSLRAADVVAYDVATGEVTGVTLYDEQDRATRVRGAVYMVHTGSWGGIVMRIVNCLSALMAAVLALTGYYLWIARSLHRRNPAARH